MLIASVYRRMDPTTSSEQIMFDKARFYTYCPAGRSPRTVSGVQATMETRCASTSGANPTPLKTGRTTNTETPSQMTNGHSAIQCSSCRDQLKIPTILTFVQHAASLLQDEQLTRKADDNSKQHSFAGKNFKYRFDDGYSYLATYPAPDHPDTTWPTLHLHNGMKISKPGYVNINQVYTMSLADAARFYDETAHTDTRLYDLDAPSLAAVLEGVRLRTRYQSLNQHIVTNHEIGTGAKRLLLHSRACLKFPWKSADDPVRPRDEPVG